jgi:formylmethanofuran dehydrogenase subunit E
MAFPEFFDQIPTITLRDPLAELLGAAEGGLIEYRFADAVKLAGHSCPTVAAAWLMTVRCLQALYGDQTPERGNISVSLGESQDSGVAGVIASVATLLTGASGEGGFKGLGGQHVRRNLLHFGVNGVAGLAFTRRDNNAAVHCQISLNSVPADPRMGELLPAVVRGIADAESAQLFRELWQDRVKRILIDHANDPELVTVTSLSD